LIAQSDVADGKESKSTLFVFGSKIKRAQEG